MSWPRSAGESGPLDGAGRRAVYVEVCGGTFSIRSWLPSINRHRYHRGQTQYVERNRHSLELAHAPLVHEMAKRWSERISATASEPSVQVNANVSISIRA